MKKRILLIWLLCFIIAYFQCNPDFLFCKILNPLYINTVYAASPNPATPTPIQAPVINITSPSSGTYKVGDSIAVKATGSNCNHMAGYVGTNYLGAQNGNSYSATFTFTTAGSYIIRVDGRNSANATDAGSLFTSSTGSTINVADDVATISVYVNAGSTKFTSSGTIYRTNLPDSPTSFSAGYTLMNDTLKSLVIKYPNNKTYSGSTVNITTSDTEGTYNITATSTKGMTDTMSINVSFANFNSSANIKYTQTGVMIRSVDGNTISPAFFATVGGGDTFIDTTAINNLIQSKGKITNNPHILTGSGYVKAYSVDGSKAEQSYDLYGYSSSLSGGINSYASWSTNTKSAFESLATLSYSYSGLMKGTITQYITDENGVNLSGSPTDSFVNFDPSAIYSVPISAPNLGPAYTFYRSVITDLNNASIANSSSSRTLTFSVSVSHVYVRFEFNENSTPTPTPTATPKPTTTPTPITTPTQKPTVTPTPSPTPSTVPIPIGSIQFSPSSCSWRNSDLNVNVYIQGDPISGSINVTGSPLNSDASVSSNGTGTVTATREGIGSLHGELHSGLANYSGDSEQYLIDKSAPSITFDWFNQDRLSSDGKHVFIYLPDNFVKASLADNLSGIVDSKYVWSSDATFPSLSSMKSLRQTTPEGTSSSVSFSIPVHDDGQRLKGWYLHVYAKDRAGNEVRSSQHIYIDCMLQSLKITDIKDPAWKDVFRNINGSYNGAYYNVSRMPVDNHPTYSNTIPKKGYAFYFSLESKGMNEVPDTIKVTPIFYWQKDLNGTNRQAIDLYYHLSNEYFIKVGSKRDTSVISHKSYAIGGYNGLTLTSALRTIIDAKTATWDANYYISSRSVAVKKGLNPETLANQLAGGYIIVQIQLEAYKNGMLMFQYTPTQYTPEGGPKRSSYQPGDIIVFDNNKSALDDFDVNSDR